MNIDLKRRLAMLPILMCSAAAALAEPVLLAPREMDHVTAGAQPVLERLLGALKSAEKIRVDLGHADMSTLTEDQHWITQLRSSDPVTFQRTASGDLVAIQPLQSGEQLVIVKQINPADVAIASQPDAGGTVTTRLLQPGETLHIQQPGSNGMTYLYINSAGNSAVTLSQQHL